MSDVVDAYTTSLVGARRASSAVQESFGQIYRQFNSEMKELMDLGENAVDTLELRGASSQRQALQKVSTDATQASAKENKLLFRGSDSLMKKLATASATRRAIVATGKEAATRTADHESVRPSPGTHEFVPRVCWDPFDGYPEIDGFAVEFYEKR